TRATTSTVYRNCSYYLAPHHSTLHSFPTRRSSDLGTTYTYFIRATNSSGSTDSNAVSVLVPSNVCSSVSVPTAPTGLAAASGSRSAVRTAELHSSSNDVCRLLEGKTSTSGTYAQIGSYGKA